MNGQIRNKMNRELATQNILYTAHKFEGFLFLILCIILEMTMLISFYKILNIYTPCFLTSFFFFFFFFFLLIHPLFYV